jgi:hypothetical protein
MVSGQSELVYVITCPTRIYLKADETRFHGQRDMLSITIPKQHISQNVFSLFVTLIKDEKIYRRDLQVILVLLVSAW